MQTFYTQHDNGVKLIDPAGEMLIEKWESYATQLANVSNDDLVQALVTIIKIEKLDISQNAVVLLGRDTRYCSSRSFVSVIHHLRIFS